MTHAEAARRLVRLLACDFVGDLVDAAGDTELRDRVLKVLHHAGALAVDAESAAKMEAL